LKKSVTVGRCSGSLAVVTIAFGFVEDEVAGTLGAVEELAVDADVVVGGVGFGAELGDGLAVDLDASGGDEFFGFAARGEAGGGDDFLQALRRRCFVFGIVRGQGIRSSGAKVFA
jgi:hypothetical protein